MAVQAKITSGVGIPYQAGVTADHSLMVANVPVRISKLDHELLTAQKLYREYFTLGSTAVSAMNVLGSVASPQRFTIDSKSDRCLKITQMRVLFESSNMELVTTTDLRRFGAASSGNLTNGLLLNVIQGGITTPVFLDPVVNLGDFFNYSHSHVNFVNAVSSTVDILILTFDFQDCPIVLPAGSPDRMEFVVRDDLRTLSSFKTMVLGSQELKETR